MTHPTPSSPLPPAHHHHLLDLHCHNQHPPHFNNGRTDTSIRTHETGDNDAKLERHISHAIAVDQKHHSFPKWSASSSELHNTVPSSSLSNVNAEMYTEAAIVWYESASSSIKCSQRMKHRPIYVFCSTSTLRRFSLVHTVLTHGEHYSRAITNPHRPHSVIERGPVSLSACCCRLNWGQCRSVSVSPSIGNTKIVVITLMSCRLAKTVLVTMIMMVGQIEAFA